MIVGLFWIVWFALRQRCKTCVLAETAKKPNTSGMEPKSTALGASLCKASLALAISRKSCARACDGQAELGS